MKALDGTRASFAGDVAATTSAADRRMNSALDRIDDAVDRRVALVRTAEWAPEQLTIVAADLIDCDVTRDTPELESERAEAIAWITERSALLKELAADGRAKAGSDCAGCPFIAGCPQFRSRV